MSIDVASQFDLIWIGTVIYVPPESRWEAVHQPKVIKFLSNVTVRGDCEVRGNIEGMKKYV